ncbi:MULTISPECIES: cytochrome c oxidase subunit 4 [unclassified Actinotalea]|uniref:cytochrome c oxidase subunit 4 n=1 Tax=unclassified Actinotalea TaxID=2638618 RepID=UPI0015F7287E|nr:MULTISPECIES: cytochrome c oxidase subunit 4 [unclassified Actinotalea]
MKFETRLFLAFVPFFILVGVVYGFWSRWEPVGVACLFLTAGLVAMVGGYLAILSRKIDARPEDDPYADIEQGAGEQGVFSPWSWWPLVLAAGAAVAFASLAIGWWLLAIGAGLGAIGLVGWVFEFSRGQHAH